MDTRILAFAGSKQSGKSSACNFTTGFLMERAGMIDRCGINEEGKLVVPGQFITSMNEEHDKDVNGILDLQPSDPSHIAWLRSELWPVVKIYNLADELKFTTHTVFGVSLGKLYGSEDDKNEATDVKWKDMASLVMNRREVKEIKESGVYNQYMTVRELLQYFGTDVCRKLKPSCWIDSCIKRIEEDHPMYALIGDARFPNEVKGLKKHGARIIKLDGKRFEDSHSSEVDLDKISASSFDAIIDTTSTTVEQKNIEIAKCMYNWEWVLRDNE